MKSTWNKLLAIPMVLSLLASCGQPAPAPEGTATQTTEGTEGATPSTSATSLKIMTTTFPEYDWVREILGEDADHVELSLLIDGGADLHSFTPTAQDIMAVGDSDLVFYLGGISTIGWMTEVLEQSTNPDLQSVDLMAALGDAVLMEEHVEGMQEGSHDHDHEEESHDDHDHEEESHDDHDHEEESHDDHDHEEESHDDHDHEEESHDHDHEEESHDDHDHEEESHDDHDHEEESHDHAHGHEDEHVWMSLKNAQVICQAIGDALVAADPDHAESYQANLDGYLAQLADLDASYAAAVESAASNTFLVADRFPFVYMTEDYDLEYYAAFSGCTTDSEASFETVVFLTEKVNELGLSHIVTTEVGHEIAQTIVDNSNDKNQTIVALDSIQSASTSSGQTYLGIMEDNLTVLAEVLG